MKYALYIFAALALVALGYWLAPEKRIIEEKIVNRDIITRIIERQMPDGTVIIDTEITDRSKEQSKVDTIPPARTTLLISGLAAFDFRSNNIAYGAAVHKQFLGPVWLGAYGMTNGTIGLSLSLAF